MSFLEMRDVVMNGLRNRKLIELAIDNKRAEIKYLADWLFDHPEIALQEVKSAKFLAGYMRKQGFEVTEQLAGMKTAWKGTKKRGTGGPKICFMAEFDALPVGHACGHHMIAAMSIGAACSEVTESMFISLTATGSVSQIIPMLTLLFQVSEHNYGLHTK